MLVPCCVFITITDYDFFPGTVATVNSILHFNDFADIVVVQNDKRRLTAPQAALLGAHPRVRLLSSAAFERPERYINAWELKAYAASDWPRSVGPIRGVDGRSAIGFQHPLVFFAPAPEISIAS